MCMPHRETYLIKNIQYSAYNTIGDGSNLQSTNLQSAPRSGLGASHTSSQARLRRCSCTAARVAAAAAAAGGAARASAPARSVVLSGVEEADGAELAPAAEASLTRGETDDAEGGALDELVGALKASRSSGSSSGNTWMSASNQPCRPAARLRTNSGLGDPLKPAIQPPTPSIFPGIEGGGCLGMLLLLCRSLSALESFFASE